MNNNNRPTQTADRAWLDYQSSAQTYFDLRDRAEEARLRWLEAARLFDEVRNVMLVD